MIPFRSLAFMAWFVATGVCAAVPRAEQAWKAGDYRSAFMEAAEAAENGDADAQFILAEAYRQGKGTYGNMLAAEVWYFRAARQGNIAAAAELGLIYAKERRTEDALHWLRIAADHGDTGAEGSLAALLYNGAETDQDRSEALTLMARAAARGSEQAKVQLGRVQAATGLQVASTHDAAPKPIVAVTAAPEATVSNLAQATPVVTAVAADRTPVAIASAGSAPPSPGQIVRAAVPAKVFIAAPVAPPNVAKHSAILAQAQAVPARTTAWRVQLGAYRTSASAQRAWGTLAARVLALRTESPLMVRMGGWLRVQANTVSYAQALTLCRSVRDARLPCYVSTIRSHPGSIAASSRIAVRIPTENEAAG